LYAKYLLCRVSLCTQNFKKLSQTRSFAAYVFVSQLQNLPKKAENRNARA
jgi:hypothetical protein